VDTEGGLYVGNYAPDGDKTLKPDRWQPDGSRETDDSQSLSHSGRY
jgi:hypothetical protein